MTWTESVLHELDSLRGGTLRRLDALAASPPAGKAIFDAWNRLEEVLNLRGSLNPIVAVERIFPDARDPRTTCLTRLVKSVVAAVESALDRGEQDPVDGLYRLSDFPGKFFVAGGGSEPTWTAIRIDTIRGDWQNAEKPGLAPSHPLRLISPIVLPGGVKALCLAVNPDVEHPRWVRASAIAEHTAAIHKRHAAVEREKARIREQQERERLAVAERLEAEADAIRRGVLRV